MSGIRRLCLVIFGLAGALCLAALALPWLGPFQYEATSLMDNEYYYLAVQVVLAITAVGVLVTLLRALFTPRKRKSVIVHRQGSDQISVTTAAISSQATHLIEDRGRFLAEKVRVFAKKRGKVSLDVRVRPRHTVNIAEEGVRLHDELVQGLAVICGDRVGQVNIEFVEAAEPIPAQDVTVENLEVPQAVLDRAAVQAQDGSGDQGIAIPLGGTGAVVADAEPEAETQAEAQAETQEGDVATGEGEVTWR